MNKQQELAFEERIAELEKKVAILELGLLTRHESAPFASVVGATADVPYTLTYTGCDARPKATGQINE